MTARRDPAWLFRYIKAPQRMRAANDPISKQLFATYKVRMPDLGMADGDVHEVIKYLDARSAAVQDARQGLAGAMPAEVEQGSPHAVAHQDHQHHHGGGAQGGGAEKP